MKALPLIVGVLAFASLVSCDIGSTGHNSDNLAHFISGFALPGVDFHTAVHPFNGQVYFLASESDQGNTDLNGDGDAADNVVHCLDPDTGTVVNLGVSARRPILNTLTRVVWSTSEVDEGGVDLTGDGDIGDQVLVSYNPALPVGPGNPLVSSVSVDAFSPLGVWGEFVVYVASEFVEMSVTKGNWYLWATCTFGERYQLPLGRYAISDLQ